MTGQGIKVTGATRRSGPLTWGQRWMWRYLEQTVVHRQTANTPWHMAVPGGVPLERVLSTLAALVSRHESLRTVYQHEPAGRARQIVLPDGEVPVTVRDAPGAEVGAVARTLGEELCAAEFAIARDWPVRVGVVTVAGAPRRVVMVADHLAVDAWSIGVLSTEFGTMISAPEDTWETVLPEMTHQPLDQASYEATERAIRSNERVLAYWDGQLRRIGLAAENGALPRHRETVLRSRELMDSVAALAVRQHTSMANVALTGLAAVLGRRSRYRQAALQLVSANRHQSHTRSCVGVFIQSSPLVVDVSPGTGFDALTSTVGSAAFHAYRLGSYDPDRLAELLDTRFPDGSARPDLSHYGNYLPYNESPELAAGFGGYDTVDTAPGTRPVDLGPRTVRGVTTFTNFEPYQGTMAVRLIANTDALSPTDFLDELEGLLGHAARRRE